MAAEIKLTKKIMKSREVIDPDADISANTQGHEGKEDHGPNGENNSHGHDHEDHVHGKKKNEIKLNDEDQIHEHEMNRVLFNG